MPELTLTTFLIVCPLVFLGGFVDAVAGGGGLISLPAYMIAGLPVHNSIATNKLSSGMGTTVSTIRFARGGNIPWKKALPCVIMAMIGSAAGARLALLVDAELFKRLMLVIIPIAAYYVLKNKSMGEEPDPLDFKSMMIRASAVALVIGMYDGFYGPGTGTFLILLLSSFAKFRLGEANGVAKSINLTTNITSLAVYLMSGKVIIILGLIAGLFGIAGNYIGVSFFNEKGAKAVKPIMLVVLTIFFIRILTEIM
ncbi:MAG: TSUP family transporter [Mogibacterium sp.]|nr:TSUP family transporter [Mogibacterium sp.]MBR2540446.1 TSUP family transporter [Mogibacterium sp.]